MIFLLFLRKARKQFKANALKNRGKCFSRKDKYNIIAKYTYESYPSNPNGSDFNIAMMSSSDGRHLVTMPHIERSIFQWNWAYYIRGRNDEVSPWIQAFINARDWITSYNSKK